MSQKTDKIKRILTLIDNTERQELLKFLQDFQKGNLNEQRNFSDALNRTLGPISGNTCPYCGK